MNPFTQHTRQQGLTYIEHASFACCIAWRLLQTVLVFIMHGIFPFITIAPELDLEATAAFLQQHNRWLENDDRRLINETEYLELDTQ